MRSASNRRSKVYAARHRAYTRTVSAYFYESGFERGVLFSLEEPLQHGNPLTQPNLSQNGTRTGEEDVLVGFFKVNDAPILIRAGQGYLNTHYRFGDYSATTLDPVDEISFWTVQEFAKDPEVLPGDHWGTWITKLTPEP